MKRLYALFWIPFFLMCLSCQNEIDPVSSGLTDLNVKESRQKTKIAKQADVLSEDDAISVAAIFSDNTQLTKSGPGVGGINSFCRIASDFYSNPSYELGMGWRL